MTSHSKTGISAALTAVTRSAATTITIPGAAPTVHTLVAIEAQSYGTLETGVVGAGGLVELENDSVDWVPCKFYTGYPTAVTSTSSGAVENKATRIKVNMPLPAGSSVKAYFTPYDNQSQKFSVTLFWIDSGFSGKQTRMMNGVGTALTQATVAADNLSISIPAQKGGALKEIMVLPVGIFEVAGTAPYGTPGGKVAAHCQSAAKAWEPTECYTPAIEALVAGAARVDPTVIPVDLDLPGNATVTFDYTPNDDLSQYLTITLKYE